MCLELLLLVGEFVDDAAVAGAEAKGGTDLGSCGDASSVADRPLLWLERILFDGGEIRNADF